MDQQTHKVTLDGMTISPVTREHMIGWGWIDGAGRELSWRHWQRYAKMPVAQIPYVRSSR